MTTKTNTNPWLMDTRVRERNLKAGSLTEKDLEKHLAALPDLEGQYDSFSTPQPALEQPRVAVASSVDEDVLSESDVDVDAGADEDDEDDEESNDVVTDEGGGEEPVGEGGA